MMSQGSDSSLFDFRGHRCLNTNLYCFQWIEKDRDPRAAIETSKQMLFSRWQRQGRGSITGLNEACLVLEEKTKG